MIPVVLSGGSGTRLWPLSRKAKPKQFLALTDDATMLQNTITRVASFPGAKAPMVAEQLNGAGRAQIVGAN